MIAVWSVRRSPEGRHGAFELLVRKSPEFF